jgi:DUF4097 and DUF4098 domain-containing protein YvlB
MKKAVKIWLITASVLILTGFMMFGSVLTMLKWDFSKLITSKYETSEHTVSESFESISVVTKTADVDILPSDSTECKVILRDQKKLYHELSVNDGVLTVKLIDTRKWYDMIDINVGSQKITIYVPEGEYASLSLKGSTGDVKISEMIGFDAIDVALSTGDTLIEKSASASLSVKSSTGDIEITDSSAGDLSLLLSTGDIHAQNVQCERDVSVKLTTGDTSFDTLSCKSLISNGSTGSIKLKNALVAEKLSVERSTGDVKLEECDAGELEIKTDTGDVKASLLSDKIFITSSSTGKISVPESLTGGVCKVKTDTGDIKISIIQKQ